MKKRRKKEKKKGKKRLAYRICVVDDEGEEAPIEGWRGDIKYYLNSHYRS